MKAGLRQIDKKLTTINEAADFEVALPKSTLYVIDNAKYQSICFSLKKKYYMHKIDFSTVYRENPHPKRAKTK